VNLCDYFQNLCDNGLTVKLKIYKGTGEVFPSPSWENWRNVRF